ncbi:hypothetical protein Goklo_024654 [Gossypium klotzschianum]|uniref:Uncharacterized protein n=1 Tax=Gossypium klotzschianum TaxID=34286 RepID=A0A7J8WBC1_9ROSI|nr:hypothetical protein [Gossypium klotzschianum]
MVLEAPAHLSTKVADGGRGSRTSEHQGADGAQSSRTSEPPRCRRLLLQKERDRDDSFIIGFGIGEGLGSSFSYILGCLIGTNRRSTAENLTGGGGHRRAKVADGARGSRTFEPPRYRCSSGLRRIRGTKVPVLREAPAHSSYQGAGCGELPNMSEMGIVCFGPIPLSDLVFLTENFVIGPKKYKKPNVGSMKYGMMAW